MTHYKDYPWILISTDKVQCNVCKAIVSLDKITLQEFIIEHSEHKAPPTHLPIGDAVARVTKAVGIRKRCTSCEQRRHRWNKLIKRR